MTHAPQEWSHSFGRNEQFRISVANSLEERRRAYEMVYRLYRREGYAEPNPSRMWLSFHNLLPETVTLVVHRADELVGTLTVVFDAPPGLPCARVYGRELGALRDTERRPAEIISLGVVDGNRRDSRDILVKLFNYVYLVSWHLRGATDFVITVNPHHADYYRKTLLFETWGPERTYGKVGGAPAVLLRLNLEIPDRAVREPDAAELRERTHYRFFHTREEEREVLPGLEETLAPMSEEEFQLFAMDETDLWDHADPREKSCLAQHYFTALLRLGGDLDTFANVPSMMPRLMLQKVS
ncbi:hypothetical protein ACFL01_00310 [Planctomycetota bacterium]